MRLHAEQFLKRVHDGAQQLATAGRRIVGMPDYAAYLEHLRCHHPDAPEPSEQEFFAAYLTSRYESGPTRCC